MTPAHGRRARWGFSALVVFGALVSAAYTAPALADETSGELAPGAREYWTPERLKHALPMPLPEAVPAPLVLDGESATERGPVEERDGQPPSDPVRPRKHRLFVPDRTGNELPPIQVLERGTSGANFSSSRLIGANNHLDYPYRTVGKLFFRVPPDPAIANDTGNRICSGSVIDKRVVLTAGHCVHDGKGKRFDDFIFVPAYKDGVAPFQRWGAVFVQVTDTWMRGGGGVPNASDFAMFEMEDRSFGGVRKKIGDVTGTLGFRTLSLCPNHAHLLGYPANLDGGEQMHQVTAECFDKTNQNCARYGSDMGGGSSGGPWVQNFGVAATGQVAFKNPYPNRVIGVTSFFIRNLTTGLPAPAALEGSSTPDSRFTAIYNKVCAHRNGNCS